MSSGAVDNQLLGFLDEQTKEEAELRTQKLNYRQRRQDRIVPMDTYIIDEIAKELTGNQFLVFILIYRHTVALSKERCTFSYDELTQALCMTKATAIRAVHVLEEKHLIAKTKDTNQASQYWLLGAF